MMSNYPPGVTGNEPEIAGPSWEGQVERDCLDGGEVYVVSRDLVRRMQLWQQTKDSLGDIVFYERMLLVAVARELKELSPIDMDCPFYGTVDAVIYGGTLRWECPLCGTEYEEEPEWDDDY